MNDADWKGVSRAVACLNLIQDSCPSGQMLRGFLNGRRCAHGANRPIRHLARRGPDARERRVRNAVPRVMAFACTLQGRREDHHFECYELTPIAFVAMPI
jgi:hypothetical protein